MNDVELLCRSMKRRELTLLAAAPRVRDSSQWIVLVMAPGQVHPLVTWQANIADVRAGYAGTFWGHYFQEDERDEAEADYRRRIRS